MLTPYSLQIDTAGSGQEALEKIQDENIKYDLIFMDHMMPEMDGIETMQKIKEKLKMKKEECPPIVMLTATAMSGMREYYLEQGFDDYLSKPIDPKELDEVLKKWLKTKEKSEESLLIRNAIEIQKLDTLNHLRIAFEKTGRADDIYFERFVTLIEAWTFHKTEDLRELALTLKTAGQQKDIQTICEKLGVFCDMVKNQLTSDEIPDEILQEWEEKP
jgi:CheY-like chemotaxis protein